MGLFFNMIFDFIIVGQGIAGSSFAFNLLRKNKSFYIVDKLNTLSSSRVALGVYNPVILKWYTKPWHIQNQLKFFFKFYGEYEQFFKTKIIFDIGVYKYLHTNYDQNNWLAKSLRLSKLLSNNLYSLSKQNLINKKFYGLINSSGRINVSEFLDSFKKFCLENLLDQSHFDYEQLKISNKSIKYKNIKASNIIFCEGSSASHNPFFDSLKFTPTKGEILDVKFQNFNFKSIVHSNLLFVPKEDNSYSVGAAYDWLDDNLATQKAKQKIQSVIKKTINSKFNLINHKCAIRPSIIDRRPFVGTHANYNNLHILNGLGSRGVLLAPYLSKLLFDKIFYGKSIPQEIDARRF